MNKTNVMAYVPSLVTTCCSHRSFTVHRPTATPYPTGTDQGLWGGGHLLNPPCGCEMRVTVNMFKHIWQFFYAFYSCHLWSDFSRLSTFYLVLCFGFQVITSLLQTPSLIPRSDSFCSSSLSSSLLFVSSVSLKSSIQLSKANSVNLPRRLSTPIYRVSSPS